MARTADAARVFVDGSTLRRLREAKGWRVEMLAAKADISAAAVFGIEAGRSGGSRLTQKLLAKALGVEPTELEG